MPFTDEKLASLIGSRICHDLISPIGAVANGLELLELSGLPRGPEVDLVNQSAQSAAARIKYFRLAFGDSGQVDAHHMVRAADVANILHDVFQEGRVSVSWDVAEDRSRTETKAALLALMCAEAAIGGNGSISVKTEENHWTVDAKGPKILSTGVHWDALTQDTRGSFGLPTNIAPAAVQFAILPDVLGQLNRKLILMAEETRLTMQF